MHLRTRTWAALSLLCFGIGGYLWHLGNQRARQSAPAPPTNQQPAASNAALAPLPAMAPPLLSLRAAHAPGPTAAPLAASSPPSKANEPAPANFRLRNTDQPLRELVRSDHAVLLRNALLDRTAAPLTVPAHLRAGPEAEAFIVQARGPITPAFRAALRAAGAEVVAYVPNNAYLVRAAAGAKDTLSRLPEVAWVGAWEPYFKLGQGVLEPLAQEQPLPEGTLLQVVGFPGQAERTRAELEQAGAEVLAEGRSPFGPRWVVRPAAERVAELARLPSVQLLELHRERVPANDLARVRVKVSTNAAGLSPADQYLGLTGKGVLVSVNDSGADASHPDLTGRVLGVTTDPTGHGTHVIGTILGDGSKSSTVDFASGSTNNAQFRGMAPAATGFVQRVFWTGLRQNDEYLQETAAATNARVQNNSWFYGAFDYDIHAASFDAAVRDALPQQIGEQPLLVVFAGGDAGRGSDAGLGGLADTIQSPGTAKNVITVGAIESPRFITNEVEFPNGTNAAWLGMTDSDDEVAFFSARGNTGRAEEGTWGRFKPDVVAPGTMLVSCRASNYVDPMGRIITNAITREYTNQIVAPLGTNRYADYLRSDAISFTITVSANSNSPSPFPDMPIYEGPDANSLTFVGDNTVTLTVPPLTEGPVNFGVGNPTFEPVSYDLTTVMVVTNDIGNIREVLSNMNSQLGPYYRYESGSSMAAATVSGMLALMEEYFQTQGRSNSPALMKALLINGARSLSDQYNLQPRTVVNHQGWGLPTLPNILPATQADGASTEPVQFVEQDATNALGTGWSHTRTVNVADASRNFPLRFTLVWTDPPANPAVEVKLVNNLDLVVTNLDNPNEVYVGNWFREGSNFSEPLGTNGLDTNFLASLDFVNNVENVLLQAPLAGARYSVTVRGLRVNVNAATTARPDGIMQDYALVVSCGNTNFDGRLTVSAAPTVATNQAAFVQSFGTNRLVLLNQRVGANPPYWTTTNGAVEQWNFFIFTNVTAFTNVAIATFLPRNLAHLQANLLAPVNNRDPRYFEADLDLFVSLNPALTNLDPAVIATADRSVGRLGTEMLIYSNATPGLVYYIGVKSEDQQSADYVLFAVASESPFSDLDDEGNQVIPCLPLDIPDGTPDEPGGATIVCFATMPMTIQKVVVTNTITHENPGDLIGTLTHDDVSVVLLNHYNWLDDTGGDPTAEYVYDDTEEEPGSIPADGPGSLNDYLGEEAQGMWYFDIVDNALHHTGRVDVLTLTIHPTADTNLLGADDYAVYRLVCVPPLEWKYTAVNVPYDATNLEVCVRTPAPLELYVRRGLRPTLTEYDWWTPVGVPGGCLNITPGSVPPLVPGRYYIGLYNPNSSEVCATNTARFQRDTRPGPLLTYENTNAVPLLDDALTNSVIFVTNQQAVGMVQVGVRIDHERASDLVLHLISPQGTRVLLAENRALTSTNGYGINFTNITTNVIATVLDNGFEGPAYEESIPAGRVIAGWRVDRSDIDVINSPLAIAGPSHTGTNGIDINGTQSGTISTNLNTIAGALYELSFAYTRNGNRGTDPGFIPTAEVRFDGSTVCSVAGTWFNSRSNLNWRTTSVVWRAVAPMSRLELVSTYPGNSGIYFDSFRLDQVEIVTNLYRYATFTEDQRLTQTPIKFGTAPFVNTNLLPLTVLSSDFESVLATNYGSGAVLEGWRVLTNQVGVIADATLAYSGTQCLALSSARIVTNLSTTPGYEYKFTVAHRGPGIVGWWPFNNTALDLVGGQTAGLVGRRVYAAGEVGAGLALDGLGDHARVTSTSALNVGAGRGLTIEGWINPTDVATLRPLVEWNDSRGFMGAHFWTAVVSPAGGGSASLYANLVDVGGASHQISSATGLLVANRFQHVAVTYDGLSGWSDLYLNGVSVAHASLGRFTPATAMDLYFGYRPSGVAAPRRYPGVMDEVSIYNRAVSGAEIWGIWSASTNGKFDPLTPAPNFHVEVSDFETNRIVVTDTWKLYTLTFVARSNSTAIALSGNPLGVLLDGMSITETGNRYWLPEEPMTPIFGENAFGPWTLEIWDNRLGGPVTNAANLLAWELQLGFIRTNPPTVLLTNSVSYTGVVSNNAWLYFAVDVPCTNGFMTNTITTDRPVDVFFNPVELPTDGPGDVLLVAGLVGTHLQVFSVPPLSPGRYYLGLRNRDPINEVNVTIQSDAFCEAVPPPPAPVIDVGASGLTWTTDGTPAFRVQWNGQPLAKFQVQFAESVEGPWYVIPGVVTSGTGEFTFLDDGSWTGAFSATRFYRIVLLP
jgi:subtilisin-like proprotein convertase family protein